MKGKTMSFERMIALSALFGAALGIILSPIVVNALVKAIEFHDNTP